MRILYLAPDVAYPDAGYENEQETGSNAKGDPEYNVISENISTYILTYYDMYEWTIWNLAITYLTLA